MQENYRSFHPRLPVIVAETLLSADNLIELPLWLVEMFKVLHWYSSFFCIFAFKMLKYFNKVIVIASKVMSYNLFSIKWQTTQDTSGMAGSESNPASLFRLYVDYGRYAEATNLLLHYIEVLTSLVCFLYFILWYNLSPTNMILN